MKVMGLLIEVVHNILKTTYMFRTIYNQWQLPAWDSPAATWEQGAIWQPVCDPAKFLTREIINNLRNQSPLLFMWLQVPGLLMGSNNTAETYYRIGRAKQRSDHNLILSIVSPHLMANTNIFYQVTNHNTETDRPAGTIY